MNSLIKALYPPDEEIVVEIDGRITVTTGEQHEDGTPVVTALPRAPPSSSGADDDLRTPILQRNDHLHPHKRYLPAIINPFTLPNYGIYISYFNTGIAIFFLLSPVTYYLIHDQGISATQYSAFVTLVYLPWSLKFLFGLVTDCVPIFGFRRKSWMWIGWVNFVIINLILSTFDSPGLMVTAALMFLMTCFYLHSDVCNDAQNIERSKYECLEVKGSIQTAAYTIRGFGFIIGSVLAAILYNTPTWGWGLTLSQLFILSAVIPLTTAIPFAYFVVEIKPKGDFPTFWEDLVSIWETLEMKAVWYPMIFMFPYAALQVSNASWTNFLVEALEFTDFDLGVLTITGSVFYFLVSYG